MSKPVAEIIVETLVEAGVRRCYGIVGDTLNRIAREIEDSEIDWVHMRHEEAGAFAAQAESLVTGQLTAIAGSCGPGSLHFINGVFEANRNRAPVVLIASQITREELGFDFIQEVDLKQVYQGCSVYCEMILTPDQARRKTVAACQAAINKRGVAVLIVPVDVSHADSHDKTPFSLHSPVPVVRPSDDDLDDIAALLNTGGKIAIYGGSGCQHALEEILQVAERLKCPIAHTSRAKEFLEPGNPYNIGMTGIIGTEAGYHAILECDTLLLLGADFAWRQFYPDKAKIVQVDIDPTHLGRRHPVHLGVVGDIKSTMAALLPLLQERSDSSFRDHSVRKHSLDIQAIRDKAVPGSDGSIPGTYVTKLINQYANDDTLFASDDGTPTVWAYRMLDMNGKRRLLASLLHGTMAGAMPSALGMQKCQPGRQVIAMCGDGGIAMLFGDLMTTIQEDLPIKIVVYDNSKLGFVEIEQRAEGMLNLFTDLKNPDFGKVAEALGLWGRTVDKADELEEAIQTWLAQPGPALLNVRVQPQQLVMPPYIEPAAVAGMALYSARAVLAGRGGDVLEMIKENFL
jgi:pyruvate dehydrogenase (quinone)